MKLKIAVIGSGISGLGAAYLLGQKHEVHLFEHQARLGGHAHTSKIDLNGQSVSLDSGFLVYNNLTYPHLKGMFEHLNVETVDSDMSLSIQVPEQNIEWAGDNLDSVFAQRKNLLKPRFIKMLFDIISFHKQAESLRDLAAQKKWTVGELLKNTNFNKEIQDWYILPMVAAIWSTPEIGMMEFPAETFLTFFLNHKLLQVNDRPVWRTVKNGSINYVNKIAERLPHIYLNEGVKAVEFFNNQLKVQTEKNQYEFDRVVFATHAPVTRAIYKNPTAEQASLLQGLAVVSNQAILHRDKKFMPRSKKCWASWNVMALKNSSHYDKVSLTYYLNRLQPLNTSEDLLLTLNTVTPPEDIIFKVNYDHPKFDQQAIDAQKKIPTVQGQNGVYFAGAWTRYGFHEDGLLSAVKVSQLFDINTPWRT